MESDATSPGSRKRAWAAGIAARPSATISTGAPPHRRESSLAHRSASSARASTLGAMCARQSVQAASGLGGSIRIGDVTISDLPGYRRDLYRVSHIGFIFQQFNLIPYLSIEENVLLPCLLCSGREQNEQGSVKQRVKQLLSELDLPEDSWGKKVRQLSIGQQQRVAAARALIGRPELIVADEPTSALDYDRRISFLDVLMKQCRQQNTTLLFVSHDLNLAPQFSRTVDLNEINHAGYHG